MRIITTGLKGEKLGNAFRDFLADNVGRPHRLRVAVGYFCGDELFDEFIECSDNQLTLITALEPPTSYPALKAVLWRPNVDVWIPQKLRLHSKLYLLDSIDRSMASIGSSNLTRAGLWENLETNILLGREDISTLGVVEHFNFIKSQCIQLTPSKLEEYKKRFDEFLAAQPTCVTSTQQHAGELKTDEAKSFVKFWRIIDHVRDLVTGDLAKLFPDLSPYLAIDHFWHFLKQEVGEDATRSRVRDSGQAAAIETLFRQYATWEREIQNFAGEQRRRCTEIQALLNPEHISDLTLAEAKQVHRCLHSSERGHDQKFIEKHTIEQIRTLFQDLIHGPGDVEFRIDRALDSDRGRLGHFGPSNVQELNGWYSPDRFPIRNEKANWALRVLGLWNEGV